MSEIVVIDNPVGINTFLDPTQLPTTTWSNGYNVSFSSGSSQKFAGYEQGFGEARVTPDVMVPIRDDRQLYYWWGYTGWDDADDVWKMFKIANSLGDHGEVTPSRWYPTEASSPGIEPEDQVSIPGWSERPEDDYPYRWTSDVLASTPYMSYGIPYAWNDIGTPEDGPEASGAFEPLKNIPRRDNVYDEDTGEILEYGDPRVRFSVIRSYKNHLVGLNFYTEAYEGDYPNGWGQWDYPDYHQDGIWWSHPTEGQGIDVSWQDANPLSESGWNMLGGGGGPIVDGQQLRDAFIIYRESSVWQMTYVGGVFVMKFQELFNDAGCLGLDCILEIEGQHIVVGQSDVYMHNGVKKESIIHEVMREELFSNIHPEHYDKVFIVGDYKHKQAWICIPSINSGVLVTDDDGNEHYVADGSCDVAYVFDWAGGTWTKRDIPNLTTSIFTILDLPEEDNSWGGGNWEHTWEEQQQDDRSWASSFFKYNPADWGLAMASTGDGNSTPIYTQVAETTFDGVPYEATVIKEGIDFGNADVSKRITRIFPIVRDGIVEVYGRARLGLEAGKLLGRGIDGGAVFDRGDLGLVKHLGTFNPATMNHLSCRLSGRYLDLQFVIPENSSAKIKGYRIEYEIVGRR